MTKQQTVKYINEAWEAFETKSGISLGIIGKFENLLFAEEKQHRRFIGCPSEFPLKTSAYLLGLQDMLSFINLPTRPARSFPQIKEFYWTRNSKFFAASMIANYEMAIRKSLKDFDLELISKFDYAELNQSEINRVNT